MANFFDQFDAAPAVPPPPGIPGGQLGVTTNPATGRPLLQVTGGQSGSNFFDQFDGSAGPAPPAAAPSSPSLFNTMYGNVIEGAEQRTSPHIGQYGEPIATGADVFTNDAGEVQFRDKSGNLVPTDTSKHVVLDVPEGKAVYARTPETSESPVVGASRVLSLGLGASSPASGGGVYVPATDSFAAATRPIGRTGLAVEATVPKLKEAASAIYNDPAILGQPVSLAMVSTAFRQIAPRLRTFSGDVRNTIISSLDSLRNPRGLTIGDLKDAKESLGRLAGETRMEASGPKPTPTAAAATIVKGQVDKLMKQLAPEFTQSDLNYSAAKAAETISGRAGKAQVLSRGGDFAGRMRTQATQLLANPRYLRGFTPNEVEQLKHISEGTLAGEKLREVSSLLQGKIGTVIGGFFGGTAGGLPGAIAGAIGGAAAEGVIGKIVTGLGNRIGANQVNTLSRVIRARSPLGQEIAQRTSDWEAAFKEMKSAPTQAKLSTLATASRSLSTSLGMAGVKVRPAELLRASDSSDKEQVNAPIPRR